MPLFSRTPPGARHNAPETRRIQMPDAAAPPASTMLLKRYRPLETCGTGGFGSVEVCLDTRLMRRVAIKRIPLASPYTRTSQATVAEALAEARTASMLSHPNIVSVIDFTFDAVYAYLVMEYVDGMSLAEFLAQVDGHSLTYDEAAAVAEALGAALSFAHENGVLHLDIKPANVLIDRKGHIRLTDFGMATLASAAGFGGARGGTIGYMPPEQLEGGTVDERSDVFALAAVLYEALCATAPFIAATPEDSLKRIDKGVLYPSDLLPNIPEPAEDALLKALDADVQDRTPSITEFTGEFLEGLGDAARGRASLAHLIAKLSSDEEGEGDEKPDEPAWELDPARGFLGSRSPRAPRLALAGMTALVSFALFSALLGSLGVKALAANVGASLVVALASGFAPQIGSALVLAGTLAAALSAAPLSMTLLPAALVFVLGGTWWFVWGRSVPGSAVVMLGAAAGALATGDPLALGGIVAAAAIYLLEPPTAAAGTAFGLVFARLFSALAGMGFAISPNQLAALYADPPFWVHVITLAALAALGSGVLRRGSQRAEEEGTKALLTCAFILPGIVVAALLALANPMEIAVGTAARVAIAMGLGGASSILVWILTFLFGYPRGAPGR